MSNVKKKIDEGNRVWIESFRRQDSELLSSVFHENGAILNKGGKIILGRENVKEHMDKWMQEIGPSEFTINTIDFYQIEEDVYEKGSYTLTISNGTLYEGFFVVIWRYKEDGKLYFYRDIGI